jgi:hypothetical protein
MNPNLDDTGAYCAQGQSGKVWFLAGTFGGPEVERYCTIPAGKSVFYPVINTAWIDAPGDEVYTDADVRWILSSVIDSNCKITSTLDTLDGTLEVGEQPAPVAARLRPLVRAQSPKNTVVLPDNNIFGLEPGKNERLIAEGYWVMLPPLTPGEHTLRIDAAGCEPLEEGDDTNLKKNFEVKVTYHLTVTGG